MIGDSKDITTPSFQEIIKDLDSNKLPMNFMLFLKHNENLS